jgi:hypothetical protein
LKNIIREHIIFSVWHPNTMKKNMLSNIRLGLWEKRMESIMNLTETIPVGSKRLPYVKEMFDYLMCDLWWMKDIGMEDLVNQIKRKLIVIKKQKAVSQYYKEYFMSVEETFGFVKYCCSDSGSNRCENTIKDEKNYCEMHKKLIKKKSEEISEFIGSSDVSMLISLYT